MSNRVMQFVTAVAVTSLGFGAAEAASIGLSFNGQDGASAAVTGTAGYTTVAQSNWNNGLGNSGSLALFMDDGSNSGATGAWSATSRWRSFTGVSGTSPGNSQLLSGYLDQNSDTATTSITISNLPESITSAPYAVYVYLSNDSSGRGGKYTVNGTDALLRTLQGDGGWATTDPSWVLASSSVSGNYYVFEGVTGSSITFTATPDSAVGGVRATVAGIQVVAAPEPASAALIMGGMGLLLCRRPRNSQ